MSSAEQLADQKAAKSEHQKVAMTALRTADSSEPHSAHLTVGLSVGLWVQMSVLSLVV